jgi:hypothetical protein
MMFVGAACGPIQYIAGVTQTASADVAAARTVNADKYAPYEYTAAVEYLHKAREEEGYADHAAAVHFGKLASDNAVKAREIALAQTAAGAPPPAPPPGAASGDSEDENPLDHAASQPAAKTPAPAPPAPAPTAPAPTAPAPTAPRGKKK